MVLKSFESELLSHSFLKKKKKKSFLLARPLGVSLLLLLYHYYLKSFRTDLDRKGQVHYSQEQCLKWGKAAAADAKET